MSGSIPISCQEPRRLCRPANDESFRQKGRFFGHGRTFGIHNPFDEDIGKAADPFINLRTLARLSHCDDESVRWACANNLAGRLRSPLSSGSIKRFNPTVVLEALIIAEECTMSPEIRGLFIGLDGDWLKKLSGSPSQEVLFETLLATKIPQSIFQSICSRLSRENLLRAAVLSKPGRAERYSDPLLHDPGLEACRVLDWGASAGASPYRSVPSLSLAPGELEALSGSASRGVLGHVAFHPASPASAVARAISRLTPKTQEIVKPAQIIGYEAESTSDIAASGRDPCQVACATFPIYGVEERYLGYGQQDARFAAALLIHFPEARRNEIFASLESINPELSAALKAPSR